MFVARLAGLLRITSTILGRSNKKNYRNLFANRVRHRLFADITDFCFVLSQAHKNPAFTHRDIAAMRFDVRFALIRNVCYRLRELFENSCGLIKCVLASTRNFIFMRGHAMQHPAFAQRYLAAIGLDVGLASLDQVFDK